MPRTASKGTQELITAQALGVLFDKAFAQWNTASVDVNDARDAPRISTRGTKPLMVVSFRHEGREVKVNRRARLSDVSANGLGLTLSRAIPVGAVVRFAFNDDGERGYGEATVVRHARRAKAHRIGLVFREAAKSLGREPEIAGVVDDDGADRRANRGGVLGGLMAFWRIVAAASRRRVEVERAHGGRSARLVVEVKLFRYRASLCVDGVKVRSVGGVLEDRLGNVLGHPVLPTVVTLAGGGFEGVAIVQSNYVVRASLAPSAGEPLKSGCDEACGLLAASAC